MLLNSPTVPFRSGNDHASVVAAAMADNLSRKRDSKGMMGSGSSNSVPPLPRAKLPRATLPHSKSVPDTGGGSLVPPQLRGRYKYFHFAFVAFLRIFKLFFFGLIEFIVRLIFVQVLVAFLIKVMPTES